MRARLTGFTNRIWYHFKLLPSRAGIYEWISYTKSTRGFGKIIHEAGKQWLSQTDASALAYQLLKYQQRHGFSNRDALRLFHAKPQTEDHDRLFKWVVNGRIHPIDVLKALKTYQSGGKLGRSKKTWLVIPRIVDILEDALELAFDAIEPTNKVFMHAVDISGSMSWGVVSAGLELSCCEVAVTMALATAKAERNYAIRGFSTDFIDLGITRKDNFTSPIYSNGAWIESTMVFNI